MLGNHLASKVTAEVAPLLLHLILAMEKILSDGSFLKKQEQPMGFHREDRLVQDLSKQHLRICFFPETEEEIQWLNSFTVTYLSINIQILPGREIYSCLHFGHACLCPQHIVFTSISSLVINMHLCHLQKKSSYIHIIRVLETRNG